MRLGCDDARRPTLILRAVLRHLGSSLDIFFSLSQILMLPPVFSHEQPSPVMIQSPPSWNPDGDSLGTFLLRWRPSCLFLNPQITFPIRQVAALRDSRGGLIRGGLICANEQLTSCVDQQIYRCSISGNNLVDQKCCLAAELVAVSARKIASPLSASCIYPVSERVA